MNVVYVELGSWTILAGRTYFSSNTREVFLKCIYSKRIISKGYSLNLFFLLENDEIEMCTYKITTDPDCYSGLIIY